MFTATSFRHVPAALALVAAMLTGSLAPAAECGRSSVAQSRVIEDSCHHYYVYFAVCDDGPWVKCDECFDSISAAKAKAAYFKAAGFVVKIECTKAAC
ncbi:hypothetical protein LOC68_00900 [Blastopirellula sp. JC732]|uniref:Uncharacterized protein n=1 Tax=Blastopirellula sediminis TaxID=2894196 RepID=A0A9X1SEL7_9BACT|nr:hypothetical protein [Blastopirellula sediminis]MCC9608256.1 hypothetical protein [Blastopirellula sediminis]MCC9626952.1 hypothetical protein [Blastopirellula sediminis]